MAQQVKVLSIQPGDPSSIPNTQVREEGENQFYKIVLHVEIFPLLHIPHDAHVHNNNNTSFKIKKNYDFQFRGQKAYALLQWRHRGQYQGG